MTLGASRYEVVIVRARGWEGVYVHGILCVESVQLSAVDVLMALGIRPDVRSCDQSWLRDEGVTLPTNLSDVKF